VAEAAVLFDGVWKKFRRGERHDSLRDLVPSVAGALFHPRRAEELEREEFWAVRDVSFRIGPGEALGVIGPNGAGKSTILKLLTRILRPTRGHCHVRGRIGALIEVAAGFHPDLTGRENVYLQGAIMGMKRAEIAQKFDAIVEFAGVGEFIDTQVKRYSSGMNARLGFAIAAHLDPDVMIIDEVLSVGDAAFQDKCVKHMHSMIARGVPLVFVSHNLPAVLELCTRVVLLGRGVVLSDGDPATAVQEYRQATWAGEVVAGGQQTDAPIRISAVELLEDEVKSLGTFHTGSAMTVRIHYQATRPVTGPRFAVDIHRADGVYCVGTSTFQDDDIGVVEGTGWVDLVFPRLWLLPGCYVVSAGIHRGDGQGAFDLHLKAYPFSIASGQRDLGVVYLEHMWRHEPGSERTGPSELVEGDRLAER
jgi:lipopolysaccharide transport system ATP-binding protein